MNCKHPIEAWDDLQTGYARGARWCSYCGAIKEGRGRWRLPKTPVHMPTLAALITALKMIQSDTEGGE